MINDEIVGDLNDVDMEEKDKKLFKDISRKIIKYFEGSKGKGSKTRVKIDEDSDEEFELVKKRKRREPGPDDKPPEKKWYESFRRYLKRGPTILDDGYQYLDILTKRQKSTLIKETEILAKKLNDFTQTLKNDA